ncbi:hypothetical protein HN014_01165 [Aquimarina sp. TRL1]|uniref:hypothetical protein n=1 Tax=Aquimarina sp. (strain TRL1) TaxID=2736252 RepID=UPI001588F623|nr:hypothetical protein [Aquimarina sp. TRL1]QKX03578.1 hypothetical protein HN014_01165 [Aquimarina sp. TRL1]
MKFILILTLLFGLTINAQSDKSFLNDKIGKYSNDKIDKLVDKKIISDFDATILKVYTVKLKADGNNIKEYTYSRLLDSLSSLKKGMKNGIVKLNNHGKDSIFIRTPYNQKMFVGLGKMSLEKLIARESKNLPSDYHASLNNFITSPEVMVKAMNQMKLDPLTSMLFGNIILIKTENGEEMSNFKIGAVLEIANRIKKTEEFTPIKQILKL